MFSSPSLSVNICSLCETNSFPPLNSIQRNFFVVSGLSNGAIRSIRLVIEPVGVRRGQSATLRCLYDLEGKPLLSLQFYRGSGEFYRYSPQQTPSKKVFPLSGINVDVSGCCGKCITIRAGFEYLE